MGNHGRLGVSDGDAGLIPLKERGKEGRRIGQEMLRLPPSSQKALARPVGSPGSKSPLGFVNLLYLCYPIQHSHNWDHFLVCRTRRTRIIAPLSSSVFSLRNMATSVPRRLLI